MAKLNLMHAIEYGYAPKPFEGVWNKNNERNLNYELRNNENYQVPFARIEFFKKNPLFSLPTEWNSAGDITLTSDKQPFRTALKQKLLDEIE